MAEGEVGADGKSFHFGHEAEWQQLTGPEEGSDGEIWFWVRLFIYYINRQFVIIGAQSCSAKRCAQWDSMS